MFDDEEAKPEKVYTVDELADLWSIPRRNVMDMIRDKRLDAFNVGKKNYRITQAMVDAYIKNNKVNAK